MPVGNGTLVYRYEICGHRLPKSKTALFRPGEPRNNEARLRMRDRTGRQGRLDSSNLQTGQLSGAHGEKPAIRTKSGSKKKRSDARDVFVQNRRSAWFKMKIHEQTTSPTDECNRPISLNLRRPI